MKHMHTRSPAPVWLKCAGNEAFEQPIVVMFLLLSLGHPYYCWSTIVWLHPQFFRLCQRLFGSHKYYFIWLVVSFIAWGKPSLMNTLMSMMSLDTLLHMPNKLPTLVRCLFGNGRPHSSRYKAYLILFAWMRLFEYNTSLHMHSVKHLHVQMRVYVYSDLRT